MIRPTLRMSLRCCLAAALFFSGCSGDDDSGGSPSAANDAGSATDTTVPAARRDGAPDTAPRGTPEVSAACADLAQGWNRGFEAGGIKRDFILTLPDGVDDGGPWPVVFNWHGLGDSAAYLIFARIFDLFAIGVFFSFSIFLVRDKIPFSFGDIKAESLRFLVYLAILLVVVVILYLIFSKIIGSERAENGYIIKTLKNGLGALSEGMKKVGIVKKFFVLFLLSLAVFLARYTFFMFALITFGVDIGFTQAVIVATAPILATIFPIQGIGGYGTIETGWVLGFMLIGIDKELALISGFGAHSLHLMFSLILSGISFPLLNLFHSTSCSH